MKFNLHHDPEHKTLTIPRAALQLSNLADAEELLLHADEGCLLVSRRDITPRQAIAAIAHLYEVADILFTRLVDASQKAAAHLEIPDPLDDVDEDVLDDLLAAGADPEGLRMLLSREECDDE